MSGRPFTRAELGIDPLQVARLLLGARLETDSPAGSVGVRIVEVEAYRGAEDPAAHSYRGRTARNAVMFGPPGHLYVYFVYGMHFCANVVGQADGVAGGVLLRAGEVVSGMDLARTRRPSARSEHDLGKGPARLTSALGLDLADNGIDLTRRDSRVRLLTGEPVADNDIRTGPRVGVGAAMDLPWRFWVAGSPAVSTYRRGGKQRPKAPGTVAR
jgi:DNA-3-methyladenine glycosylase